MIRNIITKYIIFSQTTPENIYLKYLNLSELPKGNISSPFSDDKNPSFTLYKNNTFKCNSSGKQGDVFQFVADIKQLDNKTQFNEVLNDIATEMNINQQPVSVKMEKPVSKSVANSISNIENPLKTDERLDTIEEKPISTKIEKPVAEEVPTNLTIEKREFTKIDLEYWNNLGVQVETLKKFDVCSISKYSFYSKKHSKTLTFNVQNEKIVFCYNLNESLEIYIPKQPNLNQNKFLLKGKQNEDIFGINQLATGKIENIIICAGKKDTIIGSSRGFNTVTFGSETSNPTKEQIELLQSLCNNLLICFDNDAPGEKGRDTLIKRFPQIIQLQLPINENIKGYDITDYFQEHTSQDFQKIIDSAVKNKLVATKSEKLVDNSVAELIKNNETPLKKGVNTVSIKEKPVVQPTEENENTDLTIFHKTENYLLKNYDIRFDIIANEFEMSKKDMNIWGELNDSSLYVEMQKKHLKISQGNLTAILSSDFVQKFNPLKEYFEGLHSWDKKTDYIKQFLDHVELEAGEDKEQFIYHFKKWCVRSVKCSIIEGYFNKQAFVLSDDAKGQSIGKTTFIRYLVPKALNKYYCENLPDDKDALKRLGQNFIINLDELATLSRTDINKLKSMFSSDKIKTRLPYGKKDIVISRVANFIGSTNMSTFLVDESGSVRWLCFIVKKINFNYSLEFNIDNLWSQAYALSKDENFNETMTVEDIKKNEIRNDKFQILTPERELIPKYFEVPINNENAEHLTATDILNYISLWTSGIRLNSGNIGKAMPRCGFIKQKHKPKDVWGYWVIKKPTN